MPFVHFSVMICIICRTVPSTIRQYNSTIRVFHILTNYFRNLEASDITEKNMRNEENIGHTVGDKRAINS